MQTINEQIRVRGKDITVQAAQIAGRTIVATGRFLKIAIAKDEELVEGGVAPEAELFIASLKNSGLKADIVTFPQRIYENGPKYNYLYETDNAAVALTSNYQQWWDGLPQETRKNVRRALKRGVRVEATKLDDEFVRGIKRIYDETPIRQGMRFWHYGKDLSRIHLENATYSDRSEFIGAYFEGELIGFMKWVYVDDVASIMQILAMNSHYDKRPMNALIAKAVEICNQKGMRYLVYSKFTFGNKTSSQLSDFKRRNGFEKMTFPRYFVPLTLKGRIAMKCGIHRGILGMLPPKVITFLWEARARVIQMAARRNEGEGGTSEIAKTQTQQSNT